MLDVRPATLEDAGSISELVCRLAVTDIGGSLGQEALKRLTSQMDEASTRDRIAHQWLHLCAFDETQLVGLVVVKPVAHLYHLFVHRAHQRQGIGAMLFHLADQKVLDREQIAISTVNSSLNATPFYGRLGFVPDGPINEVDGVRFQPMQRRVKC